MTVKRTGHNVVVMLLFQFHYLCYDWLRCAVIALPDRLLHDIKEEQRHICYNASQQLYFV